MAVKTTFLFMFAVTLMVISQAALEDQLKYYLADASDSTLAGVTPSPLPPTSSPSAGSTPTTPGPDCVGQCWDLCHNPVKAKNIRPCMIVCTRCCKKCNNYIPPMCQDWTTFTIEGHVYNCPVRQT